MGQITINKLAFNYGSKPILKGISHTFNHGTFTAIMGQNGSGKTTLIRCLSKELKVFSGQITLDNSNLTKYKLEDIASKIAFVPQGQEPIFGSSVFETVLLGRIPFITWAPTNEDFLIVDKVLNDLNLKHLSGKSIKEVSGGERQKIYIARAIAQCTPIIILDEPITYLDLKHQLELCPF
jgi:iron complex transport system ATP-binding protein